MAAHLASLCAAVCSFHCAAAYGPVVTELQKATDNNDFLLIDGSINICSGDDLRRNHMSTIMEGESKRWAGRGSDSTFSIWVVLTNAIRRRRICISNVYAGVESCVTLPSICAPCRNNAT